MSARRLSEIDNLYVIGILLVIFGHSHSNNWEMFAGTAFEFAIEFVYAFHMPLFYFAAGFLLMNSHLDEFSKYGAWLLRKAKRLLVPYVFWSLAALLPKYAVESGGGLRA